MRAGLLLLVSLLGLLPHAGVVAQGKGSGVLIVTVTDEQDRPVPRAVVVLSAVDGPRGKTDEQGRIEFTGLGQDPFTVNVFKRGFVHATYGQRLSLDYSIELWPSEHLAIHVRLDRSAVLAGEVSTDRGEPASEAMVTLRRWQVEDGRRFLDDGDTAGTDQYGRFRFHGLEPGLYVVTAEVASPWRDEGVQRVGVRDGAIVRTDLFASIPATLTSAAPDGLRLAAGQELGGVHLTLSARTVRTATIEGTLVVPYGIDDQPAPQLLRMDDSPDAPDARRDSFDASMDDAGHFVFRNITPGRYRVAAHWSRRSEERWATQDIDVAGEPISGITLVPRPGSVVSGRMVVLGAEGSPPDLSTAVAELRDVEDRDFGFTYRFSADRDGRFRFASVPPGRYRLDDHVYANPRSLSGAMTMRLVQSALVNGVDVVDFPFEVASGHDVTDVVLTLAARSSAISGRVVGPDDKPAPDALVIAFPADRRYWLPGSRRIALDVPNSRGRYELSDLPAGEYLVGVYLDAPAEGEWDTALLGAMVPCAVKVTIATGEKRALDLRVVGK